MKRRWQIWLVGRQTEGPPRDYDETVYNVVPYGDECGDTLAVLHNAAGNLGVRLPSILSSYRYSLCGRTLIRRSTDMSRAWSRAPAVYNRSYQRALNRVPAIGAKEQHNFDITYTLLADKPRVDKAN